MTETYHHTFQSGRVASVEFTFRPGEAPVLKGMTDIGEFTPEEYSEYLDWRIYACTQALSKLDPIAIAKLALTPKATDETELATP